MDSPDLHALLRRHWGYSQFRPKQEAVVQAILAGRDAAVVMPTGGGKSLCYQLPAVAMQQTCVVISPLIALMQDQAAGLREIGVEAAFLNSSSTAEQLRATMQRAEQGAYALLYLSPERIVREDTLRWLTRLSIGFFAIDEAHCISEWGHEFRPEYRQLSSLRQRFPDIPIAAFTASATRLVRHDILAQLHLHEPACVVMSFHRPNLRYLVHPLAGKGSEQQQQSLLLAAIQHYTQGNIIIYSPTVKGVEATCEWLEARGVPVIGYHGKMDTATRARNQELWMSGDKRVLVGTLAFGLGINKPDVRAVIHLSLPKSLEQYYQEAGRAGRDGEPADCVLLWQKRDLALLAHFIGEVQDPDERERAWQRYHVIRRFAEEPGCRHRRICLHFGETPAWESCGACDHCGVKLDWMAAKPTVRKTPPARRTGEIRTASDAAQSPPAPPGTSPLHTALREWRRDLAKSNGVPAFVILHDTALEALGRQRPRNAKELLEVVGIGEKKAERFGAQLLQIIAEHAL